jgi:hypothetical protein
MRQFLLADEVHTLDTWRRAIWRLSLTRSCALSPIRTAASRHARVRSSTSRFQETGTAHVEPLLGECCPRKSSGRHSPRDCVEVFHEMGHERGSGKGIRRSRWFVASIKSVSYDRSYRLDFGIGIIDASLTRPTELAISNVRAPRPADLKRALRWLRAQHQRRAEETVGSFDGRSAGVKTEISS